MSSFDNKLEVLCVQRVQKGALALDQHDPSWHKNVDVHTLNIVCASNCIIGQLFGTFSEETCHQVIGNENPVDYGLLGSIRSLTEQSFELSILTRLWKEEIKRRAA